MKRTAILALVGALMLVVGPLFHRGVTVLKPVLDSEGMQVRGTDGKPLFKQDLPGQLKVNLGFYFLAVGGALCLTVAGCAAAVRGFGRLKKEHNRIRDAP
jgi:hypothetical protein